MCEVKVLVLEALISGAAKKDALWRKNGKKGVPGPSPLSGLFSTIDL